jgi:DNA-binding transcriptional regulator YdaS (Cro superfamily)
VSQNETYRNLLTYALAIAGSERELAARLGVSVPQLLSWTMGIEKVPTDVFLSAVDVVLAATAEEIRRSRELLVKLQSLPKRPKS